MADTATAPAADAGSKRPEKPDQAKYEADLAAAEKAHKAAQADFKTAREKIDSARPGKGGPQNDRWQQLVDEQKEIRTKQGANKNVTTAQRNKFDENDRQIKSLIQQQKDARTRVGYSSAKEVETKIDSLMKQVDSGQMKLVDEKKALSEVSNLRRLLKSFDGIEGLQKSIDAKKAENTDLKKTFDSSENKALSEKYNANQKELDQIKAGRDEVHKNFDALKAEREEKYTKQNDTWLAIQKLKDTYHSSRKEYKVYEDQVYQARRDKQRAERDQYDKEKRKRSAEQRLEEASAPAFGDEITTAENIIRHFEPGYGASEGQKGPSKYAAANQREVDAAGFKGMSVMKKEEEDFFVGASGKKKGKKGGKAAGAEGGKFNLSVDIIEGLGRLGVDPPTSQAAVPATIEKLKGKVSNWKASQKDETEKNIAKAKAEIEKLDAEADAAAAAPPPARTRGPRQDRGKKVNQKDAGIDDSARDVNVDAVEVREAEKNGVDDAAKDLEATKIEDAENKDVVSA